MQWSDEWSANHRLAEVRLPGDPKFLTILTRGMDFDSMLSSHCQQKRQQTCWRVLALVGAVLACVERKSEQNGHGFDAEEVRFRTLRYKCLYFNNLRLNSPTAIHYFFPEARVGNRPSAYGISRMRI